MLLGVVERFPPTFVFSSKKKTKYCAVAAAWIRAVSCSAAELPARSNAAIIPFCKCRHGIFAVCRLESVIGADEVMIRRANLVPLVV